MRLRPLTNSTVSVNVSLRANVHPRVLFTFVFWDLEHLDFAMMRVAPLFELLFAHLSQVETSPDYDHSMLFLLFQWLFFDQFVVDLDIVTFGMSSGLIFTRIQCLIFVYYKGLITLMLASFG